jgi:hypothetical protein
MCVACNFGEQCVNGACAVGNCGPQSCSGCCTNNFCLVQGQQSRFTCGLQGQACAMCPMGQTCQNGVCGAPPACDVMTCPGCCNNGQCQSGQTRMACGIGGQACTRCNMGQQCMGGFCIGGGFDGGFPNPDAGMNVPAGSPCAGTQNCQPPFTAFCIPESAGGQATGYTGGYCTQQCGTTGSCVGSSICVTETVFGGQSTCRANCSTPGTQSTCRSGYVCAPTVSSITPGFCRPRCDNAGLLSACPTGQTCNAMTGVCQ